MFKKIIAAGFVIIIIWSVGIVPAVFLSSVSEKEFVYPEKQIYQETIETTGVLESDAREIYLQAPVIANNVTVEIGDDVKSGEVIATVDTNLTKTVLNDSISVNMKSSSQNLNSNQLEGLADKYGISKETIASVAAMQDNKIQKIESVSSTQDIIIPSNILAPIDGVITALNLSTNILTQTSKPVAVISRTNKMKILLPIDVNSIQYISCGNNVTLTSDAANKKSYLGKVCKIYPTASQTQNNGQAQTVVLIEVVLLNPDSMLKPGFSMKGSIDITAPEEKIVLPYEAIVQDEKNAEIVYVWENGHAVKKEIKTGVELLYDVEIISGISAKDKVLINSANLHDNQLIRLRGEYKNARIH